MFANIYSMITHKNTIIWVAILVLGFMLVGFSFMKNDNNQAKLTSSPSALLTQSPSASFSVMPSSTPSAIVSRSPFPSVSSQVGATVPWELLPKLATCALTGEIKYLNSNIYDNQDALFTYSGIDHPARNIHWTVTSEDDLKIGPNIFARMPIPNGQSLIGVSLPESPKYKKYELHAVVDYGRLVDAKGNIVTVGGNVKLYQAQCSGKTTIVLP